MTKIDQLDTETINSTSIEISHAATVDQLRMMNEEDKKVAVAVEKCIPEIAKFIETAVVKLKQGGRLFYIGAGTSGRLGVLDASECPPTFGVDYTLVQGIIAGGDMALTQALEGCEDDAQQAVEDLKQKGIRSDDCLLGIAASGRTPYVIGALDYARQMHIFCGALSCCKQADISKIADVAIEVLCGPEVISGSTRLKAGTAQKLVLNMISTSIMISLGKVYGNLMVDVKPTNEKLIARAKNLIMKATDCTREEAESLFVESKGHVKTAIVMFKLKLQYEDAKIALHKGGDNLHTVLHDLSF